MLPWEAKFRAPKHNDEMATEPQTKSFLVGKNVDFYNNKVKMRYLITAAWKVKKCKKFICFQKNENSRISNNNYNISTVESRPKNEFAHKNYYKVDPKFFWKPWISSFQNCFGSNCKWWGKFIMTSSMTS